MAETKQRKNATKNPHRKKQTYRRQRHKPKVGDVVEGKTVIRVDDQGRAVTKEGVGRPPELLTETELAVLKSLITVGCTMQEIEYNMHISEARIMRWHRDFVMECRALRNTAIRRKQWQLAMGTPYDPKTGTPAVAPNVGALIWLGKQWCGQSDNVNMFLSGELGVTASAPPLVQIEFVESDGQGRPLIIEGEKPQIAQETQSEPDANSAQNG